MSKTKDMVIDVLNRTPRNKKAIDDRKSLLIRYRINEEGLVKFIDPCCDEIPVDLFAKVMMALSSIEKEWNDKVANRCQSQIQNQPEVERPFKTVVEGFSNDKHK